MSDREDKCPVCGGEGGDPEGGGCPTCDGTGQSPSDREERIEKAHIAFTQHLDWEKDEEHGGIICSECGWSFGEMPVEPEARQLHALRAAAPFLESSPAPDEVVVNAEDLESALYWVSEGALDDFPYLKRGMDRLRAALREQEQS